MSAETKEGDLEPKEGGDGEKKPDGNSDQCLQPKEDVKEPENEEKKKSDGTNESSQANGTSVTLTPKPPSPTKEEMKILVVGDVRGQFEAVFARVTQIMTKAGIFDLLICVGEFFAPDSLQSASEWERYQSGEAAAPLPTLVMGPCNNQTAKFYGADSGRKGCEIARSIYYLGHHGVYTTTSGVTIAYMSGLEDPAGMPNSMHSFTSADIADLNRLCQSHSKFNGVDILLTAQWPYGIMKFSDQQLPQEDSEEIKATAFQSKLVAELAVAVRPRYHFAALRNCFFERRPYRNHRILQEPPRAVTRFIGLAQCNVKSKRRYYYAYKMVPLYKMEHSELTRQPTDTTECPFDYLQSAQLTAVQQDETSRDGEASKSNWNVFPRIAKACRNDTSCGPK